MPVLMLNNLRIRHVQIDLGFVGQRHQNQVPSGIVASRCSYVRGCQIVDALEMIAFCVEPDAIGALDTKTG